MYQMAHAPRPNCLLWGKGTCCQSAISSPTVLLPCARTKDWNNTKDLSISSLGANAFDQTGEDRSWRQVHELTKDHRHCLLPQTDRHQPKFQKETKQIRWAVLFATNSSINDDKNSHKISPHRSSTNNTDNTNNGTLRPPTAPNNWQRDPWWT